jgi:hypothetical protein
LISRHFRGTPSGIWLPQELSEVFGIDEKPRGPRWLLISPPARKEIKMEIMEFFRNSGLYEAYGSTEAG